MISVLEAALVSLQNRGGAVVLVDGEWHDVRLTLLNTPGMVDLPVLSLDQISLLARAEAVR